ncbi:MAG: hypothetical protein IKF90_11935, partial [Parasporobacterium sp.]|nr:hypothetical protein [Parasporobacterium sp.]
PRTEVFPRPWSIRNPPLSGYLALSPPGPNPTFAGASSAKWAFDPNNKICHVKSFSGNFTGFRRMDGSRIKTAFF